MKTVDIYQIDAFADAVFKGNPAAVCPLQEWLPDTLLQHIAEENNLSETAFFVPQIDGSYHLRWFTPEVEVDLCGHATLAAGHVLFEHLLHSGDEIHFYSHLSGNLHVLRNRDLLTLNFPVRKAQAAPLIETLRAGFNLQPETVHKSRDYLLVYNTAAEILQLQPNFMHLNQLGNEALGIIVTAPGNDMGCDFVSRFFVPNSVIGEDPVTGSAHCTLIPYWAEKLGKNQLQAKQVSARGGTLFCELSGNRVLISGHAATYMKGCLYLPEVL
ncbi:PhzF family phenazine biosynthesis protein [Sphingobacteriales bacterium UPWRP_1]|nr:isomerase [Sphingobacteriales bacterium TSM_CSS]PSJ74636.1 PhzF family phenazine biosynthesis protein [Sphingobacteriales bacterium UPWRP_1]